MPKFRKKPVVIEAIQYTGNNLREVLNFTGKHPKWAEWFTSFDDYAAHVAKDRQVFKIITLEGTMEAMPGDWIIRGVQGEHYPCKPDIFAATYEPLPEPEEVLEVTPSDTQAALDARDERVWNAAIAAATNAVRHVTIDDGAEWPDDRPGVWVAALEACASVVEALETGQTNSTVEDC